MDDTDSNKLEFERKEQVSDMIKDLRESLLVDAKELLKENMKEFMKVITHNIEILIYASLPSLVVRNIQTTLTPNSQLKPITQDTPQQKPMVEDSKNIIDEMDVEKGFQQIKDTNTLN